MNLQDFLTRFEGVQRRGDGEYVCRCPAHDDKTASLCVREGDKGIVMICQAGCDARTVCERVGLTMRDLFREEYRTGDAKGKAYAPKAKREAKPAAKDDAFAEPMTSVAPAKAKLDFVCAYRYVNEDGELLYEACRYMQGDKKTFRQRVPDASKPGGYNWSMKGVRLVLYRLPELLRAIEQGQPVFIVEGEKDVDNLYKLGRIATTSPMGAGKWHNGQYKESLENAHVYIIADNDEVGRAHANDVAQDIVDVAADVRILDIASACHELPEKGDITDFYKLLGRAEGDALLDRLMRETAPMELDPYAMVCNLYGMIPGYGVDHGRICQTGNDGVPRPLGNFVAYPKAVVLLDDGVTQVKESIIEGWNAAGRKLHEVRVRTKDFNSLSWVTEHWDFQANILPGQQVKERLRYAIGMVGELCAHRRTEYTHMGWRKINGKWAYLYHGGAIGAEGVTVRLGNGLEGYRLDSCGAPGYDEISYSEAARASMSMQFALDQHIAIPLLGTIYLAPLREFLEQTGAAPAYSLYLMGGTGTRKSTAAGLALSHFGNFNGKNLPASFNDTANAVRRKAFVLKDAPIVVDDYHPSGSLIARRKMEEMAQNLSRAFGDGADRGRLDSSMGIQAPTPPRGIAILSGEDAPNAGQSLLARYYIVPVHKGDIPVTEFLTEMQEMARQGYLRKSMMGYIKWLLAQVDELAERLHQMFIAHRVRAAKMISNDDAHGRSPENIAHIMIGYEMMLLYMRDIGNLTSDECRDESERAWAQLVDTSAEQTADLAAQRPSRMYLDILSELFTSGTVSVKDCTELGKGTPRDMVGYVDKDYYYLMQGNAYKAVAKHCRDQGSEFSLTERMTYKQLREDGYIVQTDKNAYSKAKWVDGRAQRLVWIRRSAIDGEREGVQQRMNDEIPVDESELPEEMR